MHKGGDIQEQFYLKNENKILSTKQAARSTTPYMDAPGSFFDSDDEALLPVGPNETLGVEVAMVNGWKCSHADKIADKVEARRTHMKHLRDVLHMMMDEETTVHKGALYSAKLRIARLGKKYDRARRFLKNKRAAGVTGG